MVRDVDEDLTAEYDFSGACMNPDTARLTKQVTLRLDVDTIDYFTALSERSGIPFETLINQYLADCAANGRELPLAWG